MTSEINNAKASMILRILRFGYDDWGLESTNLPSPHSHALISI